MIPNKTEYPISVAFRICRPLGVFAILGIIAVGALHSRLFKNSAFPHSGEAKQHFMGALRFAFPTVWPRTQVVVNLSSRTRDPCPTWMERLPGSTPVN